MAVCELAREVKILLDQQDGEPRLFQALHGAADLVDDHRGQPLGGFVHQHKTRPGAQDARDRQHLLFTARQLVAVAVQPFLKVGKQLVDRGKVKPALGHFGGQ